jgi:hypothetical protein
VAVVLLTRRFLARKAGQVFLAKAITVVLGLSTRTAAEGRTNLGAVEAEVPVRQVLTALTEAVEADEGETVLPALSPERLIIMRVVAVEVRGKTATLILAGEG